MNSVVQLLHMVPAVKSCYAEAAGRIFESAPEDPGTDFPSQVSTFLDQFTTQRNRLKCAHSSVAVATSVRLNGQIFEEIAVISRPSHACER